MMNMMIGATHRLTVNVTANRTLNGSCLTRTSPCTGFRLYIAEVRVDVPIYVTTCETIGNYGKGIIPAHVQKDFAKKVDHAVRVFADTLEASFKEESTDVQQKA